MQIREGVQRLQWASLAVKWGRVVSGGDYEAGVFPRPSRKEEMNRERLAAVGS